MVKEQNATIHFVDDRYETVKAISEDPSLKSVSVYMADWCALLPPCLITPLCIRLTYAQRLLHQGTLC